MNLRGLAFLAVLAVLTPLHSPVVASTNGDSPFVLAPNDIMLAPDGPSREPPCPCGTEDTLHFDTGNMTGIGLGGGGWFKAGVRFTIPFRCEAKSLLFYQFDNALVGHFFLYRPGSATKPGVLWDSIEYIPVGPRNWVRADMPVGWFLDAGTDFWVAPEFAHAPGVFPMGLDSGPQVPYRNFMYWTDALGWVHGPDCGVNQNLNVRVIVSRAEQHDVTPLSVVEPSEQTWPAPTTPKVRIRNIGEFAETDIPVSLWIDSAGTRVYEGFEVLPGPVLRRGGSAVIAFPPWHPGPVGSEYEITAFTTMATDQNSINDTLHATTRVAEAAFADTFVAHRIVSAAPSIDGTVEPQEWRGARAYDISDLAGQGLVQRPPGSNIVRFLYDEDFLYVACELPTVARRRAGDFFAICMDEDRSGTWNRPDSCEGRHTAFYADTDSLIFDALLNTTPYMWRMPGQCPDAVSASSTEGGRLQFEAKVPFGTRRGDLDVSAGDTVGVFMYSMADYGASCYGWWPQHITEGTWSNPTIYGSLVFGPDAGIAGDEPLPRTAGLRLDCYPNPARRQTTLRFSLPSGHALSKPTLRVCDATGRVVIAEPLGQSAAGSLDLDLRSLNAGVYFLRLSASGATASTPLVIVD